MGMKSALEIPFKHIAVEGVFRSRKTQLANVLAQRVGGKVVLDNVGNPYLKDFYTEREGSAFLTQLVFLANRYNQQVRLLQRDLFVDRIICDYLFEKDKIYAYQTLSDDELLVYEKITASWPTACPSPTWSSTCRSRSRPSPGAWPRKATPSRRTSPRSTSRTSSRPSTISSSTTRRPRSSW